MRGSSIMTIHLYSGAHRAVQNSSQYKQIKNESETEVNGKQDGKDQIIQRYIIPCSSGTDTVHVG